MEQPDRPAIKRRKRRDHEVWRDLIARFEQGDQTRSQFCAENDLGISTFTRWRQRLRGTSQAASAGENGSLFIELEQPAADIQLPAWDVELQLGGGMVLRLRRSGC